MVVDDGKEGGEVNDDVDRRDGGRGGGRGGGGGGGGADRGVVSTEAWKNLDLERGEVSRALERAGSDSIGVRGLGRWIAEEEKEEDGAADADDDSRSTTRCVLHVAAWRLPFYVRGRYTKGRRDVSQTPFHVTPQDGAAEVEGGGGGNGDDGNGGKLIKLGITSVEEQICPVLSEIGCGGISDLNNEPPPLSLCRGRLVYGMCKFHASGREDMDVRMILSDGVGDDDGKGGNGKDRNEADDGEGGRPFVLEVVDALRMPTEGELSDVVDRINHHPRRHSSSSTPTTLPVSPEVKKERENEEEEEDMAERDVQDLERRWNMTIGGSSGGCGSEDDRDSVRRSLSDPNRRYGRNNPTGVGIAPTLTYCPASDFGNLQSETEHKVKSYGCVCWSEVSIPDQKFLCDRLGSSSTRSSDEGADVDSMSTSSIYPLTIHQSTPLRVLHRRAAAIRARQVLTLEAKRIDDHWFVLNLRTTAGTYVKEFVHGDCGRTHPCIRSMMGGKVDIVQLDCTGIAV